VRLLGLLANAADSRKCRDRKSGIEVILQFPMRDLVTIQIAKASGAE
jgi:hypothetical protein